MTHLTPQDIQIITDSLVYRIEKMRESTDPVTIRERLFTQAVLDKLNQPEQIYPEIYEAHLHKLATDPVYKDHFDRFNNSVNKLNQPVRLKTWQEDH